MTVETLINCVERYQDLRRVLKLKELPLVSQVITEVKPKVVPIEKGDNKNTGLWTQYMRMWHPKGFSGTMGRNMKFFVRDELSGEHIGALSIGTAVYALEARDKFIGWSAEQRINKINKHVANNWRFLIFSHVKVKNLGSQVLSQLNNLARSEWKRRYGDTLVLLETFVDETECKGAGVMYKAAGWHELIDNNGSIISHIDAKRILLENAVPARTKGHSFVVRRGVKYGDTLRGLSRTPIINSRKKIFLKPLHQYWKRNLCSD